MVVKSLLESLTPRRLQLDSHDVLCERALRVAAQHVHSSLTRWTFASVQIDRGDGDLQSLWPASSAAALRSLPVGLDFSTWLAQAADQRPYTSTSF